MLKDWECRTTLIKQFHETAKYSIKFTVVSSWSRKSSILITDQWHFRITNTSHWCHAVQLYWPITTQTFWNAGIKEHMYILVTRQCNINLIMHYWIRITCTGFNWSSATTCTGSQLKNHDHRELWPPSKIRANVWDKKHLLNLTAVRISIWICR